LKDLIFVLVTVGFFGLAALYVSACGRILGAVESAAPATEPESATTGDTDDAPVVPA
jgi:hypothetical protein